MTSKTRLLANLITNTGDVKTANLDNTPPGGLDSAQVLAIAGGGVDSAAIGYEQDIFRVNHQNLSVSHTIDSADNAMSAGPVTVDSGVTLTVNGYWSVV